MLSISPATFVAPERGVSYDSGNATSPNPPYCVRIETETGQSSTVPIAVLNRSSWKSFSEEFKRLAQEAGVRVSYHVERR